MNSERIGDYIDKVRDLQRLHLSKGLRVQDFEDFLGELRLDYRGALDIEARREHYREEKKRSLRMGHHRSVWG